MKNIILSVILSFSLLALAACGGGESGDPAKTTATVKVSLNGPLGANTIAGAGFTLTLPANVTPALTSGVVAAGVITPSGTFAGGTYVTPVAYAPAAGATPGKLEIQVANSVPTGVTTAGEIVTITLQLANGASPVAADFPVSSVSVINNTPGAPIAGMSASVNSVTLQ